MNDLPQERHSRAHRALRGCGLALLAAPLVPILGIALYNAAAWQVYDKECAKSGLTVVNRALFDRAAAVARMEKSPLRGRFAYQTKMPKWARDPFFVQIQRGRSVIRVMGELVAVEEDVAITSVGVFFLLGAVGAPERQCRFSRPSTSDEAAVALNNRLIGD